MSRLLFWIALGILVVAAIRSKLRTAAKQQQVREQEAQRAARVDDTAAQPQAARAAAAAAAARSHADAETMLCCAHCGVYFPASENVPAEGRDYCSPAHAGLPAPGA